MIKENTVPEDPECLILGAGEVAGEKQNTLETNFCFTDLQMAVPTNETCKLDTIQWQVKKQERKVLFLAFSVEHFQHL